jgi:beta-glucanase (GH16 family)
MAQEQSKCKPCGRGQQAPPPTADTKVPLQLGDLVWSDEFSSGNSTPSNDVWNYDIGRGPNSDGWGNWEVQNYTSDSSNVHLSGRKLHICVQKEENVHDGETKFTSARIHTQGKLEFQYGSMEASIKLPDCIGGLWPAFWLLGSSIQTQGWPQCGEVDILELGSKDAIAAGMVHHRITSAAHWWCVEGNHAGCCSKHLDTGFDLHNGFHTYRMDWTPEYVATFVDGNLIWWFDIQSCSAFHRPFFIVVNVAVGGLFTGITDTNLISATTPGQMQMNYIRLYDNQVCKAQLHGTSIQGALARTATY